MYIQIGIFSLRRCFMFYKCHSACNVWSTDRNSLFSGNQTLPNGRHMCTASKRRFSTNISLTFKKDYLLLSVCCCVAVRVTISCKACLLSSYFCKTRDFSCFFFSSNTMVQRDSACSNVSTKLKSNKFTLLEPN